MPTLATLQWTVTEKRQDLTGTEGVLDNALTSLIMKPKNYNFTAE